MATEADIVSRVRLELGDKPQSFRQNYRGTGDQDEFDLPAERVSTESLRVFVLDPNTGTDSDLVLGTHYTLDADNGVIRLTGGPLSKNALLVAEGTAYGLFTDEEIKHFVHDALLQHTNERVETVRYRDDHGFIRYDRTELLLENLPEIEHLPLAMLATIEALWALSTDAATDIDITTAEGTHVPRSQRFAQLRAQIDVLTEKYKELCSLLNIGLWRIEVGNLRRVSRTTNRLVPIYVAREYDEHSMPTRILPPIDQRNADEDGPPSPANRGLY